jgi:hypothetical protein
MLEEVPAFVGGVKVADIADGTPEVVDVPGLDAPEMGFEFGEGHFDWIEIGTVRRQEHEPGAALLEERLGSLAFMARQIVEDDDVAGAQGRRELGLDIGLEDLPVHRRVDDPGCCQPVMAKGSDEGLRAPMAEGGACSEPLAFASPASQSGHLGGRRGLIDEDQPMRLLAHPRLATAPPCPPSLGNVSACGFVGQQRFF